jgi:pimeloyl-ACP methyl ester carboxylesterase
VTTQHSMFRTPEGQARYFAAYDATLALWPPAVESLDIPTRFGTTHLHLCGPEGAPPLVLLPGAAISSTMWYPNIAAFSRAHRVYAPDIIGDMGKSVRTSPMTKVSDFVAWLNDLFDQLHLDQSHVAGISLGGALALGWALSAPERVRKLVLLSPSSLLSIRPQFYLRVAMAILVPYLSSESRQKLFLGFSSSTTAPAIKQLMTRTDFRYQFFSPPVNSDAELRQLRAPTLLLLGEHEVIYNPQRALDRAMRLIPHLEATIVPGAGHALTFDQAEVVNERILAFLAADEAPRH